MPDKGLDVRIIRAMMKIAPGLAKTDASTFDCEEFHENFDGYPRCTMNKGYCK